MPNQNPEQIARDKIDNLLEQAGWKIQSKNKVDFSAGIGIAVREYQTDVGPADYVLFVNHKPVGIIEAKREEEGVNLTVVAEQSARYAQAKLKYLDNEPLNYVYETTGTLTHFTDYSDPKPRSRTVFAFHKPETFAEWIRSGRSLRSRLQDFPALDTTGLRPAQIRAIENLEESFKNNRPEHVPNDITAMKELFRVLKKGGTAILQVPINTKFETTYEDSSITDPLEREKHFGQYDHVRWHGLDYPKRLESVGFEVENFDIKDYLSMELVEKYRLDKAEILYVARKK